MAPSAVWVAPVRRGVCVFESKRDDGREVVSIAPLTKIFFLFSGSEVHYTNLNSVKYILCFYHVNIFDKSINLIVLKCGITMRNNRYLIK